MGKVSEITGDIKRPEIEWYCKRIKNLVDTVNKLVEMFPEDDLYSRTVF